MKKNQILLIVVLQLLSFSTAFGQVGLGKYFNTDEEKSQELDYANPIGENGKLETGLL